MNDERRATSHASRFFHHFRRDAMTPPRVLETCIYATDLDAAERFYHGVLGLEILSRMPGRQVFFRCGDAVFLVFNPDATSSAEGRIGDAIIPRHGASGAGHVAFAATEEELATWTTRLGDAGIDVESVVEWPRGGRSIYFRDPAGNSVELAMPSIWGISA
jgi:catechol 2,3-dioxygenase-like lactoylglutathione lyase family enzyme